MAYKMKMKKKNNLKGKQTKLDANKDGKIGKEDFAMLRNKKEKGNGMIIFGHTPREWKRRAKEHKWFIGALIISFVLGGIII